MNTIAIICHPEKEYLLQLLENIFEWSKNNKIKSFILPETAQMFGFSEHVMPFDQLVKVAELAIVLGGDGTILSATRKFAPYKIPVAGINLGHLGFLTLDEPNNAIKTLETLVKGEYTVENRMMLETSVYRNKNLVYSGNVLNDVVIQKEPRSRVIDIDISISGTPVNTYRGDGLIFSTPTGSTAYSLSAGGPIVSPSMELILLCPLNCHTLSARPLITPEHETLSARLFCTQTKVEIVLDGQESFMLEPDDEIIVKKSHINGLIVTFNPRNFYSLLRKKMHWQ